MTAGITKKKASKRKLVGTPTSNPPSPSPSSSNLESSTAAVHHQQQQAQSTSTSATATTASSATPAVDEDGDLVSPVLRNASVRKSRNRYSTHKVSARHAEQAMLEARNSMANLKNLMMPPDEAHVSASNSVSTVVSGGTREKKGSIVDGMIKDSVIVSPPPTAAVATSTTSDSTANASKTQSTSSYTTTTSSKPKKQKKITSTNSDTAPVVVTTTTAESTSSEPNGVPKHNQDENQSQSDGESKKEEKKGVPEVETSTAPPSAALQSPSASSTGVSNHKSNNSDESSTKIVSRLAIDKIPVRQQSTIMPSESVHSTSSALSLADQSPITIISSSSRPSSIEELLSDEQVKTQVWFENFEFAHLHSLKLLHLQANHLESLPPSLGSCTSITDLDLSENRLTSFPESLCQLSSLLRLSIASNEISKLPEQFTKLSQLTELYMDQNRLESLPTFEVSANFPSAFAELRVLHASHNALSSLPHNFGSLPNLTELNLSHNVIKEFPSELTMLKPLTFLAIDGNGIKTLPEDIFFLANLISLEARDNLLTSVPYGSLMQLECLQLDNNRIEVISRDVSLLHKAVDLSFNGNPLREIPEDIGTLSNLIRLDLSNMPIIQIPESLALLPKLRKLILTGNPNMTWPRPTMVETLETESLLEMMVKERFGTLKPIEKQRVCFVGLESSGKTTLFSHLKTGKPPKRAKATRGIEFDTWNPKLDLTVGSGSSVGDVPHVTSSTLSHTNSSSNLAGGSSSSSITSGVSGGLVVPNVMSAGALAAGAKMAFNVWDFSGADDYRILHQFFVNEGAVYVVVWNLALDESRSMIGYWLNTIRTHAGPAAPVIIVGTHADNLKDVDPVLRMLEDKYCTNQWPNVRGVIAVSGTTGENVSKVAKKICHLALELRSCYMSPPTFQKVLAAIPKDLPSSQSTPSPVMEDHQFQKFLDKFHLDEFTSTAVIRYLSAVGAVIQLKSTDFQDFSGVIADPETFVRVYTDIFLQRQRILKDGILRHDQLEQVWRDSGLPIVAHYTLIAILHKLELCFDDGSHLQKSSRNFYSNTSTFPAFLPEEIPTNVSQGSYSSSSQQTSTTSISSISPHATITSSAMSPPPATSLQAQWPDLRAGSEEISITLRFDFMPASFFSKLCCRVFSKLRPLSYWRHGFIVQSLPDVLQPNAEPEMSAFVEVTAKNDLHMWIRGSHMYSCMKMLLRTTLGILSSYRCPPNVSVHRHLQCAFKTHVETHVELVAVTMHKVEYEISKGVTVLQLTTGGLIPLAHIHSDIAEPITEYNTL